VTGSHLGEGITVHFLQRSAHSFVTMETRSSEVRGQQSSKVIRQGFVSDQVVKTIAMTTQMTACEEGFLQQPISAI